MLLGLKNLSFNLVLTLADCIKDLETALFDLCCDLYRSSGFCDLVPAWLSLSRFCFFRLLLGMLLFLIKLFYFLELYDKLSSSLNLEPMS